MPGGAGTALTPSVHDSMVVKDLVVRTLSDTSLVPSPSLPSCTTEVGQNTYSCVRETSGGHQGSDPPPTPPDRDSSGDLGRTDP